MSHTTSELVAIAHQYFPRGRRRRDPGYEHTPEYRRQMEARVPASMRFRDWWALLLRIQARFRPEQHPSISIENGSLFLASPHASTLDRCFTGTLTIPVRGPWEMHHEIEFLVSFVVPCYTIYSRSYTYLEEPIGTRKTEPRVSFMFTADELPFIEAIEREIRTDFPDHELLPPEAGTTLVPEVETDNDPYGEATIFGCLFSDKW